jgi:hypothetical protein
MIPTTVNKQSTLLPNRTVLKTLSTGEPTIADYAKATPINLQDSTPQILQALKLGRGDR